MRRRESIFVAKSRWIPCQARNDGDGLIGVHLRLSAVKLFFNVCSAGRKPCCQALYILHLVE